MGKKAIVIFLAAIVVIAAAAGTVIHFKGISKSEETPDVTAASEVMAETTAAAGNEEENTVTKATEQAYSTDKNGVAYVTKKNGGTSILSDAVTTVKAAAETAVKTIEKTTEATTEATTKKAEANKNVNTDSIAYNLLGPSATQSTLGFRYSPDGYYYCDDKDNWQKYTGYNEVYDKWAGVAFMYIDQVRIRFQYEDKNWMIEFWKGQYGTLFIGAEIGVYTCDLDEYTGETGDINHFNVADKEDWLYMQLDCYYCKGAKGEFKKVFTRPYDKYWWATGFVEHQLTKYTAPRTEIKTRNRITFKTEEQANIFVQGLKAAGFQRAAGSDKLVNDSYYCSGKDVWVLWWTIYSDSFVGYEKTA